MAEVLQEEQLAEPQAAPEETAPETPQEGSEESPQEEKTEKTEESKKEPKERNILPILTVLLVLIGIGEVIFWGYFGFSAYAHSLARERYEQQQKVLAEERAGILGGSSYSPNLKVENGTVTWEREKWGYTGSSQPSNTSTTPRREDGLRLSRLPVVKIPYTLAEMDETIPYSGPVSNDETPAST